MWDFAKGCLFQDSWHYVLLDFLFEELNVLNYWQFALPLIPYFHERMYCTCGQKRFWSADLNFGPDPVKPGDNDKLCNAEIEDRGAGVVI